MNSPNNSRRDTTFISRKYAQVTVGDLARAAKKFLKSFSIIFVCLTFTGAFNCSCFSPARKGKRVIEQWETKNNTFKVRVTAYDEENGGFVPGAYYVFQSAAVDSNEWKEIMAFRHDDPVEIPRDQICFMNDQVGYVFMGWMYAVTIDAGATWYVWDGTKNLRTWDCCPYNFIQRIEISPNGTGTMGLRLITREKGEVPELYTRDFGQHWSVK